jgi:hypothetical protein
MTTITPEHEPLLTPSEVVEVGRQRPMTLVISDEAAGLLSENTLEGAEARRLVRDVVVCGRKAGIGWRASRRALAEIPAPLGRLMRAHA